MPYFKISQFDGREDIVCSTTEDVLQVLLQISHESTGNPILVNLYVDSRIAIVGLGSNNSTIQFVDKERGASVRAIAERHDGEDQEFSYQGEATFVQAHFLIPECLALNAVIAWIDDGTLIPDIRWRTREYPPRRTS